MYDPLPIQSSLKAKFAYVVLVDADFLEMFPNIAEC
jgi:hypothetical protein